MMTLCVYCADVRERGGSLSRVFVSSSVGAAPRSRVRAAVGFLVRGIGRCVSLSCVRAVAWVKDFLGEALRKCVLKASYPHCLGIVCDRVGLENKPPALTTSGAPGLFFFANFGAPN